jgi:hypothetical protein
MSDRVVAHDGRSVSGADFLIVDRDSGVVVAICTNVTSDRAISRVLQTAEAEIPRLFDR